MYRLRPGVTGTRPITVVSETNAHKEWNGLLKDFYYMRWKLYFDFLSQRIEGKTPAEIDFYAIEEPWTKAANPYSAEAEGDCIEVAKQVMQAVE